MGAGLRSAPPPQSGSAQSLTQFISNPTYSPALPTFSHPRPGPVFCPILGFSSVLAAPGFACSVALPSSCFPFPNLTLYELALSLWSLLHHRVLHSSHKPRPDQSQATFINQLPNCRPRLSSCVSPSGSARHVTPHTKSAHWILPTPTPTLCAGDDTIAWALEIAPGAASEIAKEWETPGQSPLLTIPPAEDRITPFPSPKSPS